MAINKKSYEAERVKLLLKKNVSTLVLAFVSTILFFTIFKTEENSLMLFFVVMPYNVFTLARHLVGKRFWIVDAREKTIDYAKWENRYAALTLGAGLSFGFMAYWCFSTTDYLTQTFCIAMILGFSSGANNAYSASMKTVVSYTLPTLGFMLIAFIFKGGESVHYVLAVMTFLFFLNGVGGAKNINEMIRKQVETKLNSIKSSQMGALGEMASGMAHEINNLLTIITGQVKYLKNVLNTDKFDPEVVEKRLVRVGDNVQRISQIIFALQRYSSEMPEEVLEKLSLNQVIERAIQFCDKEIKSHDIVIKKDTPKGEIFTSGRSLEINQALVNILKNSIEAISALEEKWISISFKAHKSKAIISITDSGSGIDEEVADKMTMPFFTTKDIGQGTGLGLSTAKGIIEAHEGELRYDETSENTCFTLSLPLSK